MHLKSGLRVQSQKIAVQLEGNERLVIIKVCFVTTVNSAIYGNNDDV